MNARLAWRSIWRNRKRTLISVLSIGFGLSVALFFIAWGEGMYDQLVGDVARMQFGHVTVEKRGYQAAPAIDLFIKDAAIIKAKIEKNPILK